ncbi:MAG TPA: hypothetical protein EYH28_04480 [Anaerolineaceae bacterium]|nr:hypothetical protein [Anaerolineales bacterium]HIQ08761.1 hypothetical protein [Anaerolineaceae bacterium]
MCNTAWANRARGGTYEYSRTKNPTCAALEAAQAALEAHPTAWPSPQAWRPSTPCPVC